MSIESTIKDLEALADGCDAGVSDPRRQSSILREAIALLKTHQDIRPNKMRKDVWISAKDKLPEPGERVLTLDKWGHIKDREISKYLRSAVLFAPDGLKPGADVTHWRPLPEPPEEETP